LQRLPTRPRGARWGRLRSGFPRSGGEGTRRGDHVSGDLNIDGSLKAERCIENAVDFFLRGMRIGENRRAAVICSKISVGYRSRGLVMKKRILVALLHPGEPLMTTTGDFSANASAVVLVIFRPPTQ